MSEFFNSEIIQEELNKINNLQESIYSGCMHLWDDGS